MQCIQISFFNRFLRYNRFLSSITALQIPENKIDRAVESKQQLTGFKFNRKIFVLILALLLFSLELFFEDWIHQQPIAYLELLIVFTAYFLAGWNVVLGALRTVRRGTFFDENVLMVIATGV